MEISNLPDSPGKISYIQSEHPTNPKIPSLLNLSPKSSLLPTTKNRIVGTPDYIAPEVIGGESISN
jgi:serine/threonine protein kinase